jgi:hypothetical protein
LTLLAGLLQEMEPEERVSFLGTMLEVPVALLICAIALKILVDVLIKIESDLLRNAGPSA